jgi:hypothetical protein
MKYNGWTNRDTWLAFTWILDYPYNYQKLLDLTRFEIDNMTGDLVRYYFYFGDRIDFQALNMLELRPALLEHKDGNTHIQEERSKTSSA